MGLTDITVGAYVTAGTTITTLDATERMELAFAVPERFLGQVYPGQEVRGESPGVSGTGRSWGSWPSWEPGWTS